MKKYFTLMLLGALLISCKTEPAPIAYAAIGIIVLIGAFIMYAIMAASKLFITEGDELLKDDMTKKEEKMLKILHYPSRHPERLKNLLEIYSKRLFFKKVKA